MHFFGSVPFSWPLVHPQACLRSRQWHSGQSEEKLVSLEKKGFHLVHCLEGSGHPVTERGSSVSGSTFHLVELDLVL